MKNVLLVTDLTVQTLYPIHEICKSTTDGKCNIYIIHTLEMPTGIMDLLFLQDKKPNRLLTPEFLEAFELLRKKYSEVIHMMSFEFIWGNSTALLRNYAEARDIQSIYALKGHDYSSRPAPSVDCIANLKGSRLPLVFVQKEKEEYGKLTTLLYKEKGKAHTGQVSQQFPKFENAN